MKTRLLLTTLIALTVLALLPPTRAATITMGVNTVTRNSSPTNVNLRANSLTLNPNGTVVFPDGTRQTFNPNGTTPGFNVGSNAGDPSTPINGDLWYDSTGNLLRARINGATISITAGGGGGSQTPWTSDIDGATFNLTNAGAIFNQGLQSEGEAVHMFVAGEDAGVGMGSGSQDATIIGFKAGENSPESDSSTAVGYNAMQLAVSNNSSVALGYAALLQSTQTFTSTAIGSRAMQDSSHSSRSTAVGYRSFMNATNSFDTVGLGYFAGYQATNSDSSVFIGYSAGELAGSSAGASQGAAKSVFIGRESGRQMPVDHSIFIGPWSGTNANDTLWIDAGATTANGTYDPLILGRFRRGGSRPFFRVTGDLYVSNSFIVNVDGTMTLPDNIRQVFNPGATVSGLNVGSIAGDPSTPINGDIWYDSTANELTARVNGSNVALGSGGGGSPAGSSGQLQYNDASSFGALGISSYDSTANALSLIRTSLGATPTSVFYLTNSTAAALGAQQVSPAIEWGGLGWGTTASSSQPVNFRAYVLPVQGTVPTGTFTLHSSIAGGAYGNALTYSSGGTLTVPTSITISGGGMTIAGNITPSGGSTVVEGGASGAIGINTRARILSSAAGDMEFNNNGSTARANIRYSTFHSTKTGNYTVVALDSGTWFNNNGAAGAVILTAPAATVGYHFYLVVATAQNLRFLAVGADTIRNAGSVSGAAGNIEAATVGNVIHIFCPVAGQWFCESVTGTWTLN